MKKKRISCLLLMCMLAGSLQTGCGGTSYEYDRISEETTAVEIPREEQSFYESVGTGSVNDNSKVEAEEAAVEEAEANDTAENQETVQTKRKLIKTVEINLETEDYDSLITGLEAEIEALGGYVEYKDAYYGSIKNEYRRRNASLTVRIPAEKLAEFTGKAAEIGNITYESESVEDVTLQYVDLSSHKKMLLTEQERLMELLETAENMEDIITIESRISEVRYQIESMESQLRTYDNQVDYSTVHINITEVEHYTPQPEESTWARIKTGFMENIYWLTNFVKNLAIEFVIAIPILLVWAAVITVLVILVRFILQKKHRKEIEKLAKEQQVIEKDKEEENN